ncbi:hypothetical protein [uncultured Flavobacterium sp.]|uniref:hypothetical protein n=1 Tax=uncultured Flavobacterium sp. TaxID=165435 RepID=UPI002613A3B0|nr:hypothetical protein [uncultured Flavobacterium sp.]
MKINIVLLAIFFTQFSFTQNKIKKEIEETYKTSLKFGKPVNGKVESKITKFYNDSGNVIKLITETFDEWAFNPEPIITNLYNTDNKVVETSYLNLDGSLIQKSIFEYDSKGNNIEYNIYNYEGDLIIKWEFKYDYNNRIIEELRHDSDGIYKGIYSYESKEKKVIKKYQNDLFFNQVEYNFDKNGNEIEIKTYNSNYELISKTTKKYDSNNNLIEEINLNGNELFKYTYNYSAFNKFNQWTVKTIYINNKIEKTIIRKLEYKY